MTESDWLCCDDPGRMLEYLGPAANARKLRLYLCACCRRLRHLLRDERSRRALEAAERYAEGDSGRDELSIARTAAEQAAWPGLWYIGWYKQGREREAARHCVKEGSAEAAAVIAYFSALDDAHDAALRIIPWAEALSIKRPEQASLVRDLFGIPARPVAVDPNWLAWNDGCVVHLARTIHDERDFGELPILADALVDAGCQDETILAHCRAPERHARGCWVVDALRMADCVERDQCASTVS